MEKKKTIAEIMNNFSNEELLEIGSKFKFNPSNISSEDFPIALSNHILNNIEKIFELYASNEIKYLIEIVANKDNEKEADIECNDLVCDGLLDTLKKDGKQFFYATKDFVDALGKIDTSTISKLVSKYSRVEEIITGIINTYGIMSAENIYDVYSKLNEESFEYDEFEHFVYSRSRFQKDFLIESFDGDEYFIVDEIEFPDEIIGDIINSSYSYKILSADEYIANINKNIICDESKYNEVLKMLKNYLDEKSFEYKDLLLTLVYDIKAGNEDELMLDITTYINIATNEEQEEIKKKLFDLYNSTMKWIKKGNI